MEPASFAAIQPHVLDRLRQIVAEIVAEYRDDGRLDRLEIAALAWKALPLATDIAAELRALQPRQVAEALVDLATAAVREPLVNLTESIVVQFFRGLGVTP